MGEDGEDVLVEGGEGFVLAGLARAQAFNSGDLAQPLLLRPGRKAAPDLTGGNIFVDRRARGSHRPLADRFRGPPGSLGQQISDPLPGGDLFRHFNHSFGISEAQLHAIQIFGRQYSIFKAVHGKGDARTH